jgi:peroxiredoxin
MKHSNLSTPRDPGSLNQNSTLRPGNSSGHSISSRPSRTTTVVGLLMAIALMTACNGESQPANSAATKTANSSLSSTNAESSAKLEAEVMALNAKLKEKVQAGKTTEADLAEELAALDSLQTKYAEASQDERAGLLGLKAMLYLEVIENADKGKQAIQQIKKDYPESRAAASVDQMLAMIDQRAEARKVQSGLTPGKPFPDFEGQGLDGKPLTLAGYKGKVVLVDFWATWCGPCVRELPHVKKAYEKYHSQGFEILGISLDREQSALEQFIKKNEMSWRQHFDGKAWESPVAQKYGIDSIPATFLLDREGNIISKDLRGDALEAAVAKAISQKP